MGSIFSSTFDYSLRDTLRGPQFNRQGEGWSIFKIHNFDAHSLYAHTKHTMCLYSANIAQGRPTFKQHLMFAERRVSYGLIETTLDYAKKKQI